METSARMAKPELLISFNALSKRVDSLLLKQKKLQDRIQQLEKENEDLKVRNINDKALLNKAYKDIEFLSLSHRLADYPEALVEAKVKVAQLIRTIDSCIRLINEE